MSMHKILYRKSIFKRICRHSNVFFYSLKYYSPCPSFYVRQLLYYMHTDYTIFFTCYQYPEWWRIFCNVVLWHWVRVVTHNAHVLCCGAVLCTCWWCWIKKKTTHYTYIFRPRWLIVEIGLLQTAISRLCNSGKHF